MSNKTDLQQNNTDLLSILGLIQGIPEPEDLSTEMQEQTQLITELNNAITGKAIP